MPFKTSHFRFPLALVTGNTMVLKPSEQDPGCAMLLVELAKEAGNNI
jgi:malonate-semialdehyde dehydrogenase (acetylating)/methylmalonate-semialdehyde dehydrogenase